MKKFILVLMIASLCFASGCKENGKSKNEEINPQGKDTIFTVGYNFIELNPLLIKNDINREIFSLIYEPLFTLDENFYTVGVLGKSITLLSDDGLSYKVDLKENVTFHSGIKCTSKDVVATVNYLLNNSTYYDYNVKNILEVKAVSDYSVNITLKKPVVNLASLLTFPVVSSKEMSDGFSFNGTGRYKIDNYVERKSMSLIPSDNYHGQKNEEIKCIKVQLVPDKETANYAYSSGMADIFKQDIFDNSINSNSKNSESLKEYVSTNYGFLLLNHDNPLFNNVNVRQAINKAIDKESIAEDVLFSKAMPVSTPIFNGAWCYNENAVGEYNIEEAKNILKKEGFYNNVNTGIMQKDDGETLVLSFNILVNSDNNFRIQVANKISENLKYIGIDCKVKVVSFEEYKDSYINKTYEAFLGSVPMTYDFDLSLFMGEENVSNYKNSTAQNIINGAALEKDASIKKSYLRELQNLFTEDVPHISLYYTKEVLYSSGKVKKGLNPTEFNMFNNIENWSFK